MKLFGDLTIENNRLIIGGCDAKELADQYGTPLYVFDVARAEATARSYEEILKEEYPDHTV